MLKDNITIDEAIAYLNELVEIDPEAITELIETRVPCNVDLAEHPTVQVSDIGSEEENDFTVGFLGILNGLFGVNDKGWGTIGAKFDDEGEIIEFINTDEFEEDENIESEDEDIGIEDEDIGIEDEDIGIEDEDIDSEDEDMDFDKEDDNEDEDEDED